MKSKKETRHPSEEESELLFDIELKVYSPDGEYRLIRQGQDFDELKRLVENIEQVTDLIELPSVTDFEDEEEEEPLPPLKRNPLKDIPKMPGKLGGG